MFLSRCEINPARRGARQLLGSPQALHAAVRYAFPSTGEATGGGRVLWRLDSDSHRHVLYTVSPHAPDFSHLVEEAGWPSTTGWESRDYDGFLGGLRAGQTWAFRLAANPVHSGRRTASAETQRFGHITAQQQHAWLLTRCGTWGFDIPEATGWADGEDSQRAVLVRDRAVRTFRRGEGRVTLSTAVFEGTLRIVDAEVMRASLIAGMGHAKAYGCGLMTLARPSP
ncbi:MAG: type I-E CRISPR-associated protein Cas6/Cse3/CasE [Kineosporiaceae bacterium]|nr:type I-E CRISPR-associated protein Cas6/Cse3/CasE [Kineosporiaceae bacterium]